LKKAEQMPKKPTIFQEIFTLLVQNVIPNITMCLSEMGMRYVHIPIMAEQSIYFFNHIRSPFPFDLQNLQRMTLDGQEKVVVYLTIRNDGQISVAENLRYINGLVEMTENVVIANNFFDLCDGSPIDNIFLFYLSNELTARAKTLENDRQQLLSLVNNMKNIKVKITRNVLLEKVTN